MGASTVDSPLVYTTTSTPLRWSPWANSAINNSVPPYLFGGTAMNGGAIRATLIGFKLNNTNKMPNPTLAMRKTWFLPPIESLAGIFRNKRSVLDRITVLQELG